jgi:hypothetical protein
VVAAIPKEARARLELMLTGQLSNGGAMPIVRPFEHRPGHEKRPEPEEYRSDDCLWFFNAIPAFVGETGDLDFYNKVLPYADEGEATVFGHLRRALKFNLERTGRNGLPCGLAADWNDCLQLGYYGESLFVAFQVRLGLTVYAQIAERLGQPEEAGWALAQREILDTSIQASAWDGEWFIWAIGEDGTVYGTRATPSSAQTSAFFGNWVFNPRHPPSPQQRDHALRASSAARHFLWLLSNSEPASGEGSTARSNKLLHTSFSDTHILTVTCSLHMCITTLFRHALPLRAQPSLECQIAWYSRSPLALPAYTRLPDASIGALGATS